MDIKSGDRVYVKHQNATPYAGVKGHVTEVDNGFNYPVEVELDGVDQSVFYTARELRVIVGTERKTD